MTVALFVAVNTASSINQFLLAGIKRVAGRTDLSVDFLFGGACQECVTAQALYGNFGIIWVNTFFHLFLLSMRYDDYVLIDNYQ